jgi:sugar phosphate permease
VSYLQFVLHNARFLGFGILLTFFGNFGQTYYIALFSAPIRADFGLSHGEFGVLYSTATLSSAACLVWVGRKIDDINLRSFVLIVCGFYAAACFVFSASTASIFVLGVGLFLLRMTGQGLMGHSAMTGMARYFQRERGKAMSVASIGHPFGEAILPSVAVAMLAAVGWQTTWQFTGILILVVLMPGVVVLLHNHGSLKQHGGQSTPGKTNDETNSESKHWTRSEVIRDRCFYFIVPCALAAPLILTGLFFHQVHLAGAKGWSLAWMASCFIGYAIATVAGSLTTGSLVDRFGALSVLPWYLLPLTCGLLTLASFSHAAAAMVYLVAAGLTTGASSITLTATWAEIYGTAHIGAIRALVSACMVFSTSLAPAIMGWFIDHGVSIEKIAVACVVYIAVCVCLILSVLPKLKSRQIA